MKRGAGILLHITSLNSDFGFGCFSKDAFAFVDFLASANQKYWQILPLQPVDDVGCPYRNLSLFAIEPTLIDLEEFFDKETLKQKGFSSKLSFKDYRNLKLKVLKELFEKHSIKQEQLSFEKDNDDWLDDYATYVAVTNCDSQAVRDFVGQYKLLTKNQIQDLASQNHKDIEFAKFVQYIAYKQWSRIQNYAHSKGVSIIGDMPFYPAPNSDVVMVMPQLFDTNGGYLSSVAGVPPDYFNENGQVWYNPIYNIKFVKQTNYEFLLKRFNHLSKLYDYIRIDHFRAYESFFKIPLKNPFAKYGKWEKGFGGGVFKLLPINVLDKLVLEDLGVIDDKVLALKDKLGFPNMKVYQFAFDGNTKNPHLPKNYSKNCIAYLGTHDNSTFCGFLGEISQNTRQLILNDLHLGETATDKQICYAAIESIMASNANVAILLPQDLLCQDNKFRINTPGTIGKNWKYRLPKRFFDNDIKNYLISATLLHNR